MSIINASALLAASVGEYQISRSVRLRSSATAYFNRTPASATNQKTLTLSAWVKRGALGVDSTILGTADSTSAGYNVSIFRFTSTDTLRFITTNNVGGSVLQFDTTAVFRDPSAWYHVVLYIDTTQATNTNGIRIYVNGVNQAGTYAAYTQNTNTFYNSTIAQYIGRWGVISPTNYFDGYQTEINFIDGQALTPSSFGQTNPNTGVWQPLKYTGTYGTNGFYLNFSDNSSNTATTIGKDYSGNGNNWTPNNISVTAGVTYDSMLDVPTLWADGGNGRGNYCVLNSLSKVTTATLAAANLETTSAAAQIAIGSIGVTSGKYYWEFAFSAATSTQKVGVYATSATTATVSATTNVIGVKFDADTGSADYTTDGTNYSSIGTGLTSGPYFPYIESATNAKVMYANFGQRPFTYTPPSGFVALNTQNLPAPTISNGATVMAATTYTGTGASLTIANTVNGVSFQPDFVWVKGRSGATDHALYDSVRGTTKDLASNTTAAETTQSTGLTAFGSTGFTVGALAKMNTNTATYVGWQWNAGAGTTSSNTSGSITSTVSVNATAGFSVVTYTGNGSSSATVGHGLGVTPSMIICKTRSDVNNWFVFHKSLTSANYIQLNTTAAQATIASTTNGALSTSPTSSTFGFTAGSTGVNNINTNTSTYVAYCFAAVAGYSAFGSYTGNGSADGPFVYCGFRPRWVMCKRTDSTENWLITDNARNTSNVVTNRIYPNLSQAEDSSTPVDFLSNGFKIRAGAAATPNISGGTYIFMAFAENPFKLSLAR